MGIRCRFISQLCVLNLVLCLAYLGILFQTNQSNPLLSYFWIVSIITVVWISPYYYFFSIVSKYADYFLLLSLQLFQLCFCSLIPIAFDWFSTSASDKQNCRNAQAFYNSGFVDIFDCLSCYQMQNLILLPRWKKSVKN